MAAMTPKRTPVPHVKPISEEPPSAFDAACSERLERLLDDLVPRESAEEQRKRAQVLATLSSIFREWVCSVCLSQGLPDDVANGAGGQVFTSGSYRLGLNERGMDIDTICVAPRFVTRVDFFDSLKVTPSWRPDGPCAAD